MSQKHKIHLIESKRVGDLFGQNPNGANQTQPGAGIIDTGDVKIPEEADLQRARQILDELRRRSSEQFRPKYECDYLRRLLERF